MNKTALAVIIVLILLAGSIYFINSNKVSPSSNAVADSSEVKTFTVSSSHLRFYIDGAENPDIIVKEGDKIRINFDSTEGFHDWKVDEFNAATAKVSPGNKTSVEFIADKKGTFEYYCSVGKHRENGMKGKLIVE